MKGDVQFLAERGAERIRAPYHGITLAGTQRLLYIHEECVLDNGSSNRLFNT
jgi:hypothetical protein